MIRLKISWKPLLLCLAVPLAVGGVSAYLTMDSMQDYASLQQPPLSPPGWVFPVVWTILFLLMGAASYLVLMSSAPADQKEMALRIYGLQLAVNFCWPLLFFRVQAFWVAFVWLILLWALILLTIQQFGKIEKRSAYLLVPYLIWVTFAGYLNFGVAMLN